MLLGPVTDHLPYVTTSLQILVQRLYPHINPATQPRPPSRPAGYVRMMQAPLSIITVTLTISHMRRHHTASVDDLKDVVYSRTGLPLQLLAGHQPIADQVIHQVSCTLSLEDLVPLALLPSKISESGSCTVSPAGNGLRKPRPLLQSTRVVNWRASAAEILKNPTGKARSALESAAHASCPKTRRWRWLPWRAVRESQTLFRRLSAAPKLHWWHLAPYWWHLAPTPPPNLALENMILQLANLQV